MDSPVGNQEGRRGYAEVRRRAGLQRLDGADHNSGYQIDTVTATGRWDRISACPIATGEEQESQNPQP